MAYQGTTSTSPNLPQLVSQGIAAASSNVTGSTNLQYVGREWVYSSTHISSDIEAANFFTDGKKLGMLRGDRLTHISFGSTAHVITSHTILDSCSTTFDLGVGTTIGLGS